MATTEMEVATEPKVEIETDFPQHRMTVDRYERLVASGVYGPKDPVFLWKGRLVEKMTKGDRHAFSMSSTIVILARLVPNGWAVRPDQPILLDDESVPEPDLAVVRGSLRDYGTRKPKPGEIALVIEVSDSSLRLDSGPVLRAYAANSIPIYWIVNIPAGRVEVYTGPTGPVEVPGYRERRVYGPDDEVPVLLDGREIGRVAVKEILL